MSLCRESHLQMVITSLCLADEQLGVDEDPTLFLNLFKLEAMLKEKMKKAYVLLVFLDLKPP